MGSASEQPPDFRCAGQFAFEQDLGNVRSFHEAVKAGKEDRLAGSLAELLVTCTKHVDKNFRTLFWRLRFWRPDVQQSYRDYKQWRVSPPSVYVHSTALAVVQCMYRGSIAAL